MGPFCSVIDPDQCIVVDAEIANRAIEIDFLMTLTEAFK
jgi:hypothetical protein